MKGRAETLATDGGPVFNNDEVNNTLAAGLHVKQVKLLLKGAGIEPEYDPADFGVYVYDRKAVDKAVAERPDFWAYQKSRAQAAAR